MMNSRKGQKSSARVVREQLARERRRRRTLWTSAAAGAVLVIAGLIGWAVYQSQRSGDWTAPAGTNSAETGIVVGSGPVTVDVYEDFICPICKQFEQQSGPTLDQLVSASKVKVVYHPVAYLDRASSTDYSTRSAAASGCAANQGKFREYAKALFDRQPPEGGPGLDDGTLISIGTGVGMTGDSFGDCVRNRTYQPWIEHVTDEATKARITGTPTILVAGKQVPNPTPEAITAAVTAAGR